MARRNFTQTIRDEAYRRAGGRCEQCGCSLDGRRWDADHRLPDWMGGKPTLHNCQILCSGGSNTCHGRKTAADARDRAKSKRIIAKAAGTWRPKRKKLPKGRALQGRGFDKTKTRTFRGETKERTGPAVMR